MHLAGGTGEKSQWITKVIRIPLGNGRMAMDFMAIHLIHFEIFLTGPK